MYIDPADLQKILVRAVSIAFCGCFEHVACESKSCEQDCDACPLSEGYCTVCTHVDTLDCPYCVTRRELL